MRAFVLTTAVVAGAPVLLIAVGGNPLPEQPPTVQQMQAWLRMPFDPRYAAATAIIFCWLMWAAITVAVGAAVAARIRRRRWVRLLACLPGPVQGLTATLIGAATVTVAGPGLSATAASAHTTSGHDQPAANTDRSGEDDRQRLKVAAMQVTAAGRGTVTVKHGDTLSSIAEHRLGDADRWPAIFQVNRGRTFPDVGGRLTNPDLIYPGWRLTLPAAASPGPGQPERRDDSGTPRPAATTPQPDTTPATPEASTPAGEVTPSTAPATTGQPVSAAPNLPGGSAPTVPGPALGAPQYDDRPGVPLPGGWLPLPLAGAIAAAGTLVWLRRRHRYAPHTRTAHSADPDLLPLPPVMTTINRHARRHSPEPAPPPPTVTVYLRHPPAERPELAPPGPDGPQLTGLSAHPDGCGLRGPGAAAAARALLVATLSAGIPQDPDAEGVAVIPAGTLTALLGDPPWPSSSRLHIHADLPAALDHLDDMLLERNRILHEYDVTDLAALRAADACHPPMPPVLLLTHTPPEDLHPRLDNLILLGRHVQITAILLGNTPTGTIDIQTDGRTPDGRLAVLDAATARQLLTVLHEAHTGDPVDVPPAAPEPDERVNTVPTETPRLDPDRVSHNESSHAASTSRHDAKPAAVRSPEHGGSSRRQAPTPRVPIRLLGPPTIKDRDGKPITGIRHHARELLIYLAVHRNGANLADIMEAFWPTATMRRAAQRLSTETANLRRLIRQAAADPSIQPVVNTGGRYHLDPGLLQIDLWDFDDTLLHAATADPPHRAELLRHAIDLHTGALADGYHYDWITSAREHVRRHGIRARLEVAELLHPTDPAEAAALIDDAATLDPINEDVARRALNALAAAGNTAAAQAVLHRLRDALHDIEEEPSPETLALAARLQPPAA
ncbi:BTAD domain-containing putative transcriptional regulator [Paractinoplanes rishiriensis]|uniref:BTAD domain-containing putative transcriptional regulator n=1 Tax=Paractinoplanes rishiriensis TaxID=1050105 RepID=UPI001942D162|nr:BTAD domain-containing putative transcriptional regulator [Actinoplanes rishiriensis]